MDRLSQDDLQSGKKSALYTDFASTILVYLCEMVPDKQDAEDLLLEVFMAAFNSDLLLRLPAQQQLAQRLIQAGIMKREPRFQQPLRHEVLAVQHYSRQLAQ
jgi:hypothetical protein